MKSFSQKNSRNVGKARNNSDPGYGKCDGGGVKQSEMEFPDTERGYFMRRSATSARNPAKVINDLQLITDH